MVQKASLKQLTPIAEGGFGKVYRVGQFTLPGDISPLAYKEFTTEVAEQGRSASSAAEFRDGLTSADRARLDGLSAWPRAIVTEADGTVCGLLMPLIPADFFCELHNADKGKFSKPRDMGWLIASAELRRQARIDLPDIGFTDRLLLLAQLVYAIGWLHRHGWVFGDLSFRNAVFALDPPRIMLLDCDGAAALTDAGRKQPTTPFWEPPESQAGKASFQDQQDTITDVYKLGLAILRCLTPGHGAASTKNPQGINNVLDAEGAGLVAAALSDDRSARPTAKRLYAYLRAMAAPRVRPPVINMVRLATPVVQKGQQGWLDWQVQGGHQITVTAGVDVVAQLDARVAVTGCAFRPLTPGPVRVEVTNQYGKAVADVGYVIIFEPPPVEVRLPDLPAPSIPAVRAGPLDAMSAAFPGVPDVRASVPPLPAIGGLLDSAPLEIQIPLPSALPDGTPAIPWPDFHDPFIEAALVLSARLLHEEELRATTERASEH